MKARYLFIIAVVCALLGVVALRANNHSAAVRLAKIIEKDNQTQPVSSDVEDLRKYVFRHMNSSVHFELTGSYNRAVAAASAHPATASGDLYSQAQAACDHPGIGSIAQAQCVQEFLSTRLQPGTNPQPPQAVDRSQYTYSYVSPSWTPDLAGGLLLGAILLALASLTVYTVNSFKVTQAKR